MKTLEIPRPEWSQFFRNFNALHSNWRCTIEILAGQLGAQTQSQGMQLTGIGTDGPDDSRIQVALESGSDAHLTHTIDSPQHVWLLQDEAGHEEVLEIETAEARTLLHFRPAN